MSHTNKHVDITDPNSVIIAKLDTTGAVSLPQFAGIPAVAAKGATGQIISVHGVVPGTTVIFENSPSK
jgi:hypothetical protein